METIERGTVEWSRFLRRQRRQINARLKRYRDPGMARMELAATGDLTPYRHYKTETVSRFLHQALDQMKSGTYGVCVVCGEDIPIKRLELVPAALACVSCDGKRGGST